MALKRSLVPTLVPMGFRPEPQSCEACLRTKGGRWIRPPPSPRRYRLPRRARGSMNWGSVSQGNRIQVSWDTSVTKLSTAGRPAGLA
jgi:hypothetical protein